MMAGSDRIQGDLAGTRGPTTRTTFHVVDLDCPECAKKVHGAARRVKGVMSAELLFSSAKLVVEHTGPAEDIIRAVANVGNRIAIDSHHTSEPTGPFLLRNRRALLTLISGVLVATAYLAARAGAPVLTERGLLAAAIVVGGYMPVIAGMKAAFGGFSFDMNFLMTLAVMGAVIIGEWTEGATVIFLFSLGNTLEAYTLERTRRSIRELIDLAPAVATVRRNGSETTVPASDLQIGDTVLVMPGARIPADAVVTAGESAVNQAPITGESVPEWKSPGSEVFAGSINGNGYLEGQVSRAASDTTLAKIIRLVEEAQAKKSPIERFVDRFARYYTPSVIGLAVAVAVVPSLFGAPFGPWFYRALSLLVVSCPCALVISTPVSIAAAIANAARNGVLVKGGAYIEQAGSLAVMAFDKTGTVTLGKPSVTDVLSLGQMARDEVLALAASVEDRSEHPFGQAIVHLARQKNIAYEPVSDFQALSGRGARGRTPRGEMWVASPEALAEVGVDLDAAGETVERLRWDGKTVSVLSDGKRALGIMAVADTVRPEAQEAISGLKKAGIRRLVMLTGDNERTAQALASAVGITEVYAGLLPQEKVEVLRNLAAAGKVAMVGDGINDAPALAAADIGIAMGVAGTDVALETADIALMGDDLRKLPFAIELSRSAMRIVRQNVAFSIAVKLAAVALVFPGLLTLWLAIAADTGAALVVILNGMRLLRLQPVPATRANPNYRESKSQTESTVIQAAQRGKVG